MRPAGTMDCDTVCRRRAGQDARRLFHGPLLALAGAFVVYAMVPAVAQCVTDSSAETVTCTGDLSGGESIDADDITSITMDSLTADAASIEISATADDGTKGGNSGDGSDGGSTTSFTVSFDGSDTDGVATYGIDATSGDAVEIELTAGSGGEGEKSGSRAYDGGDGGSVGDTSFDIENATTFEGDENVMYYVTIGGDGGKGGTGKDTTTETGRGGDGGDAGSGGGQSLTATSGELTALSAGTGSFIYMSSQGGTGGEGGEGKQNGADSPELIGGKGGAGGAGGDVTVEISTTTEGSSSSDDTPAIRVESLAGAGGEGGKAVAGDFDTGDGGNGGSGGAGGTVEVTFSSATIDTTGLRSIGLIARSYGGDGGEKGKSDAPFGSNGDDGSGGNGGSVTVTFGGSIITRDTDATGVLVQSVGGFGGNATGSTVTSYAASSKGGGSGGTAKLTLSESTIVKTGGDGADGVHVQSVGGSGGKGNSADDITALGGDGSNGGDGGAVTITVDDDAEITTTGEHSNAVFAASIGGGGGSGGSASGITSVGGSGGEGGTGGAVDVTIGAATLSTDQSASDGIYAASVGGGGGKARSTTGISSVGGSGGDGGDAGTVTVSLNGATIETGKSDSNGVVAHSIGGGGGSGASVVASGATYSRAVSGSGGDGGSGGFVELKSDSGSVGSIITKEDRSRGVVVMSIGGGGGSSGDEVSTSSGIVGTYSVGMTSGSGAGGAGGEVKIDETYFTIQTGGDHSHAILAQSIGGGGGSSGSNVTYSEVSAISVTKAVGSTAGSGGAGAKVTVTVGEMITTTGDQANGILAQSIGGGGGNSGMTIAGSSVTGASLNSTIGGSAGNGGAGDAVTVTLDADLTTGGQAAHGVVAQSIGGGGGSSGWTSNIDTITGSSLQTTVGGDGGGGGDGGRVEVYHQENNTLTVTGDNAVAIRAQSIGGSGGSGDITVTGEVAGGADISIGTGGSGGAGGSGGEVIVVVDGPITAEGELGSGIIAQSIGGSGGNSALFINGDVTLGTLSFSSEGNGGSGGKSGTVTLDNDGTVTTKGNYAPALVAQSIAGGGGSATGVIAGEIAMAELSITLGGNGGGGGESKEVTVKSTDTVSTSGVLSHGILAQSIGGDGGNGGYSIDGSLSAGEYTADVDVAAGGNGGDGGTAGEVKITNSGAIGTSDYGARGISAQSIGGSGGDGGSVYSGVVSVASGDTYEFDMSVGGTGGDGGAGGAVNVYNESGGDITTQSFNAMGIFAQSVGGDGGVGGNSFVMTADASVDGGFEVDVAVGGDGGDGATGGAIYVENDGGVIKTEGASSSGIYAQSIGGNGGVAGSAGTVVLDMDKSGESSFDLTASVAVGGNGGSGSNAGTVEVYNYGDITAEASSSSGIFAQSIGGGGGDGGSADAYIFTKLVTSGSSDKTSTSYSFDISIGGDGAAGGDGNTVTVENTETINTGGFAGYGIFAQSVGGGGGTGGNAESSIGDFIDLIETAIDDGTTASEESFDSYVYTAEDIADDLYQVYSTAEDLVSISKVLSDFEVDVGGSGGASGEGGKVTVTNSGDIITTGDSGTAIFAQSIGGGGGNGGDASGEFLSDATIGGSGSRSGDGGEIYVNNTGLIQTSGDGAMGIFAQSVGGGGGTAGDVELGFSESFESETFGVGVVDEQSGGDGGAGGEIIIDSYGEIISTGDQAHGIWAQSIGGSGGALGADNVDSFTDTLIGNAGDDGDGGTIQITVTEDITLSGDYATAIFAQSLGGSDSTGGTISITVEADVSSSGTGGWGIVTQTDGDSSGGDLTITIDEGATISTGSSSNSGNEVIYALGGGTITINNKGTITKDLAFDGSADASRVIKSDELVTINNTGTIQGGLELADDIGNSFNNESGALFETGQTIDFGDSGSIANAGTISPGGEDNIITSKMVGSFSSDETDGILLFDLDLVEGTYEGSSDQIYWSSTAVYNTYNMYGTIEINVTDSSLMNSGDSGSSVFAEVLLGELNIDDLSVSDSATVDYSISALDDILGVLEYTVDYTSDDLLLGTNQNTAGDHIDTLVTERKSELAAVEAGTLATSENYAFVDSLVPYILNIQTGEELKANYDRLAPGDVFAAGDGALFSSLGFSAALDACRSPVGVSTQTVSEDGSCAWFQAGASHHNRKRVGNSIDYDETAYGVAGGLVTEIAPDWYGGFAFGYESFDQSNARFDSDGDRFQGGVLVRRDFGATSLSASVSGGYSEYDFTRTAFGINETPVAKANPNLWWVAGHARIGHTVTLNDRLTIEPSVDVGITSYRQGAFDETGAGDYQLRVSEIENTVYSFNPAVDLTTQFEIGGKSATATLRAGVMGLAGDVTRSATAQLSAVPGAGPSFVIVDDANRWFADLGAAVEARVSDRVTLEAEFDTLLSSDAQHYGGLARLRVAF